MDLEIYIPSLEEFPSNDQIDLSTYFREKLVYLFFHLTRKTDDLCMKNIGFVFQQVLQLLKKELYNNRKTGLSDSEFPYLKYLDLFYRLVVHTRDIFYGKGEHDLFYVLLYELYKVFPSLAVFLIYQIENFGAWRDIKYLCLYVKEHSKYKSKDGLIKVCIELVNSTLKKDLDKWKCFGNNCPCSLISSIAKWIPREKPRFKWLFDLLVIHWSNHYERWRLDSVSKNDSKYENALNKCKKIYRKNLSKLNKFLDTTEIKQCSQRWDEIDPTNISKFTIAKQFRLFLSCYQINNSSDSSISEIKNNIYKMKCSQKYIEKIIRNPNPTSSPNSFVIDFPTIIQLPVSYYVKEAFRIIKNPDSKFYKEECILLNHKWEHYIKSQQYTFTNILPILDISYKMQENDAESFYVGIGFSLLIAQKSTFGKRILCLENNPSWINLDECTDFISMIENFSEHIRSHNNTSFSFECGIDLLGEAISKSKYNCKNMKIVLFSNGFSSLNIDNFFGYFENHLSSKIRLIFWNLSKKEVFDIVERVYMNALLISGFSSYQLRMISDCNYEDSAYDLIYRELNTGRYQPVSDYLNKLLVV